MPGISPIHAYNVNETTNNGISRQEATEIVRNALNEFQRQVSEPLISTLTDGSSSSGSWLEALAKVLGEKLDRAADKLKYDAAHVNQDSPGQTTELSAEAQKFSMMMDAFNNVVKTLGQALDSSVRKD